MIDVNDTVFSSLQVWRDINGDGVINPGELQSLTDAGIASISLASTPQTGFTVNGNIIQATGTFTRSDGSTGAIGSVAFNTDPFHSQFDGDTTISADAAAMPDLKGYGTLADLRVAMTLTPSLIATINADLPNLDLTTLDLATLRQAVMPILSAWAAATPERDADGTWHSVTPSTRPGIAILTTDDGSGNVNVLDFAYQTAGGAWKRASGTAVSDASGNVITDPTLQQVLDETEPTGHSWGTFTGTQIDFMERYMGVPLPLDAAPADPGAMLQAMKSFISGSITALNLEGVRLLMQGPLASYFVGVVYDPSTDKFRATTDQQLAPMYEQIFLHAPGDPTAALEWVSSWRQVVNVVLGDLDRSGLMVSYGYMFASMVHAYETVGLPISITRAAEALGVPAGKIIAGGADLEGTSNPDIFYMAGGDQVARGGDGPDDYVVGQSFGHDVIDDTDSGGEGSGANADILRLTGLKSTDITAERNGLDLIIHVNGDPSRDITVLGEFTGVKLGLTGVNMNDDRGVAEITFADGVVWDKPGIANAVSQVAAVNGVINGTPDNDVLDPGVGPGNITLIGGDGGDIYVFGRGYGHDTIDDQQNWVWMPAADAVRFNDGITADDLTFSRDGNSLDLNITINGTSDELTIHNQFLFFHNIIDSEPGRIEEFGFSDGTTLSWEDVIKQMDAAAVADQTGTIYGFDYDDVLDPGPNRTVTIEGGNGNDTYVFDKGYGHDTIFDNTQSILAGMDDTVIFKDDILPSDVTLSRVTNSNDLLITLSSGDTLTIKDNRGQSKISCATTSRLY